MKKKKKSVFMSNSTFKKSLLISPWILISWKGSVPLSIKYNLIISLICRLFYWGSNKLATDAENKDTPSEIRIRLKLTIYLTVILMVFLLPFYTDASNTSKIFLRSVSKHTISETNTKDLTLLSAAGELVNMKQKESAKPSRNVHSGKPELRHYQQSFLP